MKTLTIDHNNGNSTTYQLIEASDLHMPVAYHAETPAKVIEVLEHARKYRTRLKLHYGDIKTGIDWNEENDVEGYIGICRGTDAYFPILLHRRGVMGGGTILDHCIVKIKLTGKSGQVIYRAANYVQPEIRVAVSDELEYAAMVTINDQVYSRHKTQRSAEMLMHKLS